MKSSPFKTMILFVAATLLLTGVISTYAFHTSNFMITSNHVTTTTTTTTYSVIMMARGRGGNLKRALNDEGVKAKKKKGRSQDPINSLNEGKGQEITGVTLPAEGTIKAWEFGERKSMVCTNVDGTFFAIQGDCPRCSFDLWKGELITNDPGFDDLPRVACPTCATTFSMKSGKYGPRILTKGLSGFVSGLARSATAGEKTKNADAFRISIDSDTGRVFFKKQ